MNRCIVTAIFLIASIPLVGCSVSSLERVHAHDQVLSQTFNITGEEDTMTILTWGPESRMQGLVERHYPFGEEDKREIEAILNRHGVLWHLDRYYPLIWICDGETLAIDVTYDGKTKDIWCNNNIPWALRRIPRDIIAYYEETYPDAGPATYQISGNPVTTTPSGTE